MDEELKESLLRNISLTGAADNTIAKVNPIIANRDNAKVILSLSSGLPKISHHYVKRFKLILTQPVSLRALNAFEIRCCLCGNVISYPAWYYKIEYAVNHFHYFICWNDTVTNVVTARCRKRS